MNNKERKEEHMKKLLKCLKIKDLVFVVISIAFVFAQVKLDLKLPEYTSKLTELVSRGSVEMSDIYYNGGMMLLLALLSMASSIICGFFAANVAANYSRNLRGEIFESVEKFSLSEVNNFSTASLITRSTNDVIQIQNLIAIGLQILIKAPILAFYAIRKISNTNVEWTRATIMSVIVILVIITIVLIFALPKIKKVQKLTDGLNNAARENITGVRVVRAFNAEKYQGEKFAKVNTDITKNNVSIGVAMSSLMPVLMLVMNALTVIIYMIGAKLINDAGLMERAGLIGDMTAFTQYALQVIMAFMMMVGIFIFVPRSIVSGRRISEILNTKVDINDGDVKNGKSDLKGYIEFKNVGFKYPGSKENTLNNINFKVSRGETLAIIGSTGSGKTSLINLISRFYDVTDGEVLVDGINVKEYDQQILRDKVAVATQKASLFKGDILENISFGNDEKADLDRVSRALNIAQAEEFVSGLKDGVSSFVAQGGSNFSGGQKQRLSIARTIYKDAEIMIFDDSFSALDYKTDRLVRASIKENAADATVIIVAQRIGTIKNADKIIVLDDGKIAGMGTHRELLDNCSVYKEIALSQLSEEEL